MTETRAIALLYRGAVCVVWSRRACLPRAW